MNKSLLITVLLLMWGASIQASATVLNKCLFSALSMSCAATIKYTADKINNAPTPQMQKQLARDLMDPTCNPCLRFQPEPVGAPQGPVNPPKIYRPFKQQSTESVPF